jgi:uncharacterized protein YdeI (YjbR/CyaY-like superfamily)
MWISDCVISVSPGNPNNQYLTILSYEFTTLFSRIQLTPRLPIRRLHVKYDTSEQDCIFTVLTTRTKRMNPLVSKVHGKETRWSAEYAALRQLCLASGLNEELKWGQACYDLGGRNVVLIHGFKSYCALLFMKGALLKDPKGILIQQTKNVQAARQIRFASLDDINRHKAVVKTYIREAIAVEKSGAKVKMRTAAEFEMPAEFLKRLDDDPELAEAFHALTPGRQKGYLLHFAGAKQSATRTARIEKHAPRILKGLGLDD